MKTVRFLAAVLLAVIGGIVLWSRPWKRLKGAFYLWWDSWHTIQVDGERYRARLATCKTCPIFFRPLLTCGTPFLHKQRGCWCHMPTKSRMLSASCWIRDHEPHRVGLGWRDEL